jgi:Delta24-sterol reductase
MRRRRRREASPARKRSISSGEQSFEEWIANQPITKGEASNNFPFPVLDYLQIFYADDVVGEEDPKNIFGSSGLFESFVRPYIIFAVVLPLSFIVTKVGEISRKFFAPSPELHLARVEKVQQAVKLNRKSGSKICTDRSPTASHSVRNRDKSGYKKIPMRDLRCILGCTESSVTVEPGVTVGELTKFLIKRGKMLECTLEMEHATLGGLAMATGMTTHSHVCGLIHDTVLSYDVVLAGGKLVHCTEDNKHSDLFYALPWSHGTLGLLVGLTLSIVPSQPYVCLKYTTFYSKDDFVDAYADVLTRDEPPFFAEAIVFSKNTAVIMEGELADKVDNTKGGLNTIGYYWKPWFFTHVRDMLTKRGENRTGSFQEYIPIYDYLMRHDRSMCMTMPYVLPFGNHWLFRFLFGWLLPPNMALLKASHTSETREDSARKQVYQDLGFPMKDLSTMIDAAHNLFEIYPLLCYPCKIPKKPGFLRGHSMGDNDADQNSQMFLNFGIYGVPKPIAMGRKYKTVTAVRGMEWLVRKVGGFQHTYCDSFQTKEEFAEMFDHELWEKVRTKYGGKALFPGVYEKTRANDIDWHAWLEEEQSNKE